jgi:hypothetical protein
VNLTTIEPVAQITIAPMVRLVDLDGNPVPDCERHVPTCPPDPDDPAEWPESNDVDGWHWETGPELDPGDVDAAAAALEDLPFPDAPDADPALAFPGIAPLIERMGIMPVSGGAPEPFEPTAEDLADYGRWSAELDARRDQVAFYATHPLAEFHALRTD